MLKRICLTLLLAVSAALTNHAILVTPSTPNIGLGSNPTNPNLSPLTLAYKGEADGKPDGGYAAGWYTTTFTPNAPTDEAIDASITWDGGDYIHGVAPIQLLVKGGNQTPTWYLFDISSWDGKETIEIKGFWPNGGAISHVSIYTLGVSVPDAGATAVMLGLGIICLATVRRRKA